MEALWFGIVVASISLYVVMDGFDFGAGALHLLVARDDRERRQVLSAIGPFWDGNEVWLLATGGVLFLAFPKVLASGLSGFYLAIFLLVWVLILRGIAIELRSHLGDAMWRSFWDATFAGASTLAPVLLGAALGNLVRGVPLDDDGWFALSFFESFSPHGEVGILDWYTVLAGVVALAAIVHHGALFLAWRCDGPVATRGAAWAGRLLPVLVILWIAVTAATARVAPGLPEALAARPAAWGATAVFVAGLVVSHVARRRRPLLAFLGSSAFLLGALAATAAAIYPTMIRSIEAPDRSLTARNAAAHPDALAAGLLWWPAGFALAVGYTVLLFRIHRDRVTASDDER